ncbi:hypothetical protein [Pseudodesulfovibrio karagichevae]|uniref:Uncharacterized protein n=1 Tax=Pseudodesulfovibrio karagichevae TaxID=3239305 RepID=A0ABV4K419_9BACT
MTTGMAWDGESFGPAPIPARTADDVKAELAALDMAAVRPLRAVAAGTATTDDTDKLAALESQAATLRAELAALESQE